MVLECFRSNPNDHHLFLIAGEDYGDPWPSAGGSLIAATWPQKMTSRGPPRRMPCHRFLGGSPSGVVESPSCVSNFFGHRIWMPFPTDRHRIFFRATHILEEPIRVSYVLASSSLALCILPVKEDTDVKTENQ